MSNIIPPTEIPPSPSTSPAPRESGKSIICECCASRLDRHGNLLRRGDLARQMIEADDKIAELKKHVLKAQEDLTAAKKEADDLRAQIPAKKKGFFDLEV